jgi:hypothetical protein
VGATPDLDVVHGRLATHGIGLEVMELEEAPLLLVKTQRPPSRIHTARLTCAGMWREPGEPVLRFGRGCPVAANFFLAKSSRSAVRARSTISAVSTVGTACRSRSVARLSFSHMAALAVNRISYRSGARGVTFGRWVREGGTRGTDADASKRALPGSPSGGTLAGVAQITAGEGTGIALAAGSLRTEHGISGRGKCRATSSSTSRLVLRAAAVSSSWWFSPVRWGANSRTVVRFTEPSRSIFRMGGNLLAARAASMRL